MCDLLIWINQAFLCALSNDNKAVTLLTDSFDDLIVKTFLASKLVRQLWNDTEVDLIVRETSLMCDKSGIATHELNYSNTVVA